MAAMRTEELKGIDKLGPIGIAKEAVQIFRTHAKVFLLIQLAFMADLVALSLVAQYFLFKNLPGPFNPDPTTPPRGSPALFSDHHHHPFPQKFEGFFGTTPPNIPMVVTTLAISFASGVVFNGFMCLSLSATIYSVGLYYAGKAVSFLDVIRATVPRLWMRLGVTTTYGVLLGDCIVLVQTVGILFLLNGTLSIGTALASNVLALLSLVLGIGFSLIFSVAQGVSVLEGDYGWAAMIKGLKLLKGKVKVAILLRMLLAVPVFIQVCLVFAFQYGIPPGDLPEWHLLVKVLTVVPYIFWTTFLVQFMTLCFAVQYVSFKAHHESVSIIDCIYQKQTGKVGYQRIGKETDVEPLSLGEEAGSNV